MAQSKRIPVEVIALGISAYNFRDEQGKSVSGANLHCIDLSGMLNGEAEEGDRRGSFPVKMRLPFEVARDIMSHGEQYPALVQLGCGIVPSPQGRPELKPFEALHLHAIEFAAVKPPKTSAA